MKPKTCTLTNSELILEFAKLYAHSFCKKDIIRCNLLLSEMVRRGLVEQKDADYYYQEV